MEVEAVSAEAVRVHVAAGDMHKSPSISKFENSGMRITFKSLSYSVPSNTQKGVQALLLNEVNGFFNSGEMTALMGPSGSGKTTLLDVLAGRKTAGTTTGSLLFSGSKPSRAFLRRFTGYVEQFDTLLPLLTVEEMLLYTAELKRPMTEPLSSKKAAVEDVLQALALMPCRDVKIGDPMNKGISGGQAKRVNIGLALVTSPRVLFLDEPTSGLDSFTANEVMSVVRGLVSDGVTICATIHSPTAYAFGLFDSLMMLTRGRVVYFGRAGAPAVAYAQGAWSQAGAKDAAAVGNYAEWLTEIITKADRDGGAAALADTYARSDLAATNVAALEGYMAESASVALPEHLKAELAVQHETVTPWWWGLKTLVKYRTPKNYKDGDWLGARIGDKFFMTTLMWTLYWGVGRNFDVDNYVNMAAILFMFIVLPAYGAASYVPSIVLERSLYVRERSDGLYYPITYLCAKMVDELLIATVCSVGFSAAAFFAIGFQGSFGLFWLVYLMVLYIGVVLAYGVAAVSPNMDVANALLPVWVTIQLLFGGFILDWGKMPVWWKWFSYLDFLRYAWGGLMVNQFSGPKGDPVWLGGKTVLQHYNLKDYDDGSGYKWYQPDVNMWHNVAILVAFFVCYFILAWAGLKYKVHGSR